MLHGELAELTATAAKTNQKLEHRTKQFQLLLHALQDLQTDLTAESLDTGVASEGNTFSFLSTSSLFLPLFNFLLLTHLADTEMADANITWMMYNTVDIKYNSQWQT